MKNALIALLAVSAWVTAFAEKNVAASDGFRALLVGLSDTCKPEVSGAPQTYAQALAGAGHVPVVICRNSDTNALRALVRKLDAIVFTGGEDVNPARYGDIKRRACGKPNDLRDGFDFALMAACVAERKPILGICRGAQVMNVFFGGTLYQDIPTEYVAVNGSEVCVHAPRVDKGGVTNYPVHEVSVKPGSRLAKVIGNGVFIVNSLHHQGVKRLAPQFTVTAVAADGFVEAIEHRSYPAVGLQFHPENTDRYVGKGGFNAPRNLGIYRDIALLLGFGGETRR